MWSSHRDRRDPGSSGCSARCSGRSHPGEPRRERPTQALADPSPPLGSCRLHGCIGWLSIEGEIAAHVNLHSNPQQEVPMPKRQRKNAMRDGNCPFRLMDRTMTLNRSHFTQQVPPGNRTIRSRQSVTLSNEKLAILRFSHDSMDNELAFPRTQHNIAPATSSNVQDWILRMSPGQRLGSMLKPSARSRNSPVDRSTWLAKSHLVASR